MAKVFLYLTHTVTYSIRANMKKIQTVMNAAMKWLILSPMNNLSIYMHYVINIKNGHSKHRHLFGLKIHGLLIEIKIS